MKLRILGIAVCLAMLAVPAMAYENPGYIELVTYRQLDAGTANNAGEIGMWEYVYDFQGGGVTNIGDWGLRGGDEFDVNAIINTNAAGNLNQQWNYTVGHATWTLFYGDYSKFGSMAGVEGLPEGGDPTEWRLHDDGNSVLNAWHAPDDYTNAKSYGGGWNYQVGVLQPAAGRIMFSGSNYISSPLEGLIQTFRIVSPDAPGQIEWFVYSYNDGGTTAFGSITGPVAMDNPVGDFDGDGDVDADDIDLLFANLGGADLAYDLTGDGLVDSADVDEWVFNTVPIGANVGTVYGDFNLDGAVDAGDLALLGTNFGAAGSFGWADGDANGDGVVDAGDLALLGSNFGTVVHPVPEPVTMSLLAIGGAALLRRKK